MPKVIYQHWIESERGWGQRPDGFSLHISEEARIRYIKEYEDTLPTEVPDIYDRPAGRPVEIEISDDVFNSFFTGKETDGESSRYFVRVGPEEFQDHFEAIIKHELENAVEEAEIEKDLEKGK